MSRDGRFTGGGSRKGRLNRHTADIKGMITAALHEAGGQAYLVQQAHANPQAFLSLLGKILPKVVVGDENKPLVLSVEDRREAELAARQAAVAAIERAFAKVTGSQEQLPAPEVIEGEAEEVGSGL
jgi:hypothetical protein